MILRLAPRPRLRRRRAPDSAVSAFPPTRNPGALFASGTVNLTMPLASWLGLSDAPGNVAGFGPLDADDSRAIADALSARTDTRWCLTLTDSHGRPVAHGCARAGPPPSQRRVKRPTGPPGARETGFRGGPAGSPPDRPAGNPHDRLPDGPRRTDQPTAHATDQPTAQTTDRQTVHVTDRELARPASLEPAHPARPGPSASRSWRTAAVIMPAETAAYRPSPGLRHLVEIRHATCTYPGCRRPATRCDADHTVAYHRGGRTCLCNLAPLCRRHHAAKQASGWRLEQASPGVMAWTTPAGRRYVVGPTGYPG